ncbi:MAG: helix-turn-helix transcriptional regulator [Clostridia bacterium]|nr:helix-turn-helix transcriptional regulator [Clostridia bacterium]
MIRRDLAVDYLVTVHYFEYSKDYAFKGERHNFWELLYVDKGEVVVTADDVPYTLRRGDIIFHKPDERHTVTANGVIAPNLVVISFGSESPAMRYFENKRFRSGERERALFARIIEEAKNAFSSPLDDPATDRLLRADEPPIASEQMVVLLLEELLISLCRRTDDQKPAVKIASSVKQRSDNDLVGRIIGYLEDNVFGSVSFSDVCYFSAQSATNLKTIFKSVTGMGVMEYYRMLKIEQAKRMLREGGGNITQIADQLGYTSVHYFSRYFKRATGMTPSEYTLSIQAKIG